MFIYLTPRTLLFTETSRQISTPASDSPDSDSQSCGACTDGGATSTSNPLVLSILAVFFTLSGNCSLFGFGPSGQSMP